MGVLPLTFFSLAAAGGPHAAIRVSANTDVVLSGRVQQLTMVRERIFALFSTALVVLDPSGNVIRRLPLPSERSDNFSVGGLQPRKQAAKRALFDKADFPESLRETPEAERWLQDEASAKDRPIDSPQVPMDEMRVPLAWQLASNQQYVFVASALGLWTLDTSNDANGFSKVAGLRMPPSRMAVSPNGKVLVSDPHGDYLVDSKAAVPFGQACGDVTFESVEIAVFDAETTDVKAGLCESVIRAHRNAATVWLSEPDGTTQIVQLHARALAGCGTFGLINAAEGLFMLSKGNTTRLGQSAPYPLIRCSAADPDTVISFAPTALGAEFSEDLGNSWVPIPALSSQATIGLGKLDHLIWAATDFGLLRLPDSAAEDAHVYWQVPSGVSPPKAPAWLGVLPVVHLTGTVNEGVHDNSQERVRVKGMIAAEFPLGAGPKAGNAVPTETYSPRVVAEERFEKTPSCLEGLRLAAVRLALTDPQQARIFLARARTAAWLPELRVRAEKRWGRNQSVDINNDTTLAPLGLDTVNDFRLEVRASWDLARLVYSPDELAIATAGVRAANAAQDIALLVNRLFFQRRQHGRTLTIAQRAEPTWEPTSGDKGYDDGKEPTAVPLRERIAEITADLDALTGGLGNTCW